MLACKTALSKILADAFEMPADKISFISPLFISGAKLFISIAPIFACAPAPPTAKSMVTAAREDVPGISPKYEAISAA